MSVTISRKLNIVLPPIETKDGELYIHSTPVGRQVFESCYRSMAKTVAGLVSEGIGPITGPSVALLALQSEADLLGEGDKVSGLFMSEVRRLTNCAIAGKDEIFPYAVALQRNLLDEDQASEVENILVYFTLVSWIRLPSGLSSSMGLDGLQQLWRAQTTSSDLTAFMRSLPTSTPVVNTGEKTPTVPPAPALSTAA
jgi:hypothetical protein